MIDEYGWLIDDGCKCIGLLDLEEGGFGMVSYIDPRAIIFKTKEAAQNFKQHILNTEYTTCVPIEHCWLQIIYE